MTLALLAALHSIDTTRIIVVFLAVILAIAASQVVPHPYGWLVAAVIILLGVLYLFG